MFYPQAQAQAQASSSACQNPYKCTHVHATVEASARTACLVEGQVDDMEYEKGGTSGWSGDMGRGRYRDRRPTVRREGKFLL